MSLKVNGQTYSWGDVDVKIPGLVLVVQEISYDDEQDMEESYGKGNRPRGYGKGNYKASGKMSMLRDDYDDVLAYRALLRNVETAQVFEKSEVKVWECRNCGHIVVGTAAPEVCPTCRYSQSFFEIHCENY